MNPEQKVVIFEKLSEEKQNELLIEKLWEDKILSEKVKDILSNLNLNQDLYDILAENSIWVFITTKLSADQKLILRNELSKILDSNNPNEEKLKNQSEISFDSLLAKANPEVKKGLTNFKDFLLLKKITQEKIDSYFALWLISIVGDGYLKLWNVIIGKNKPQTIEEQTKSAQWEQLMDFLTKTSDHFWLLFYKPNSNLIKKQLDMPQGNHKAYNNDFYRLNDRSNLFNSIWILINRECALIQCFVKDNKRAIGCLFRRRRGSLVCYCDGASFHGAIMKSNWNPLCALSTVATIELIDYHFDISFLFSCSLFPFPSWSSRNNQSNWKIEGSP